MKTSNLILSLLLLGLPVAAIGQESAPNPLDDFWNDPVWVKRFLGSYGFSGTEPRIAVEDKDLLDQIRAFLPNQPATAAQILESAVVANPETNAALLFVLGQLYFQMDNLQRARSYYLQAVSPNKFPDYMKAHRMLGMLELRLDRPREALEHLSKAIALGDPDGRTYGLVGFCYTSLGKYLSAEAAIRRALVGDPDDKEWKRLLLQSLMTQEKYKEVIGLSMELLQQTPNDADLWLFQANAYLGLGEMEKVATNFEIVRRMGKAKPDALTLLGNIYLNRQMIDLALIAFLTSIQADPKQSVNAPIQAAEGLTNYAAYKEATTLILSIRKNFRGRINKANDLTLLTMESQIAIAFGQGEKAARKLEQIIDLDPLRGRALLTLGIYYADIEPPDIERAQLMYERAENLEEFEVDALIQHARLMVKLKRWDDAAYKLGAAQDIKFQPRVQEYLNQVKQVAKAVAASSR